MRRTILPTLSFYEALDATVLKFCLGIQIFKFINLYTFFFKCSYQILCIEKLYQFTEFF